MQENILEFITIEKRERSFIFHIQIKELIFMRTDGVGDFKQIVHSVLPSDGVHGEGSVTLGPLHPLTEPQT